MKISDELIAQAKKCETVEELVAFAQEHGVELSAEEADIFLRKYADGVLGDEDLGKESELADGEFIDEGELADEELDNVSGGAKGCKRNAYEVEWYAYPKAVRFVFKEGDTAQAFVGALIGNETATVRITSICILEEDGCYTDGYQYERISGSPTCWSGKYELRSRFEKR